MLKPTAAVAVSFIVMVFSLPLSFSAFANVAHSETATGMVEAAIHAICDGDKARHLSLHQRKIEPDPYYDEKFAAFHRACNEHGIENIDIQSDLDDAQMQAQKRRYHIHANIVMGDGAVYATTFRVMWGSMQTPEDSRSVEAWRLGGISRVEVPILRETE